jgi:hypothetical protein
MEFNEKLLNTIEQVAKYFANQTVLAMAANVRKKKIVNTRELLNSIDEETKSELARMTTVIYFAFTEYGRYVDMKRIRWRQQPPVDKILEWVEQKGIHSFGRDPRPYKNTPKTPERRKNEIAWGIALRHVRRKRGAKPRPWFQTQLYSDLAALYEEIALGVSDRSAEEMIETLTWRMKRSGTSQFTV